MILRRRCIHAPIFVILLVALVAKATCASEMPIGEVIMQLRSGADTNNSTEIHERVGDVTEKYLNQYFDAYYTRTEEISPDYFSDLTLSTNSFGVHGVEGSFITTIEIEGTLSFNSDELPSSFFIDTLLRNAFTGRNEQLYVDELLTIDDKFLKNLAYLIIDINKGGVTESQIREHDTSATKNVDATSSSNEEGPAGSEENGSRKKWVAVIISFLALIILYCSYYAYRWYKQRAIENEGDGNNEEPMKVIKLPVKNKQSSSSRPSSNRESKNNYNDRISPTSTASTLPSPGSFAGKLVSPAKMDRPPPSPQRSMTSQASSKFTYTDNMSRFTTNNAKNNVACTSPGMFSKFSLDVSRFTTNNAKNNVACASPGNFSKFSLDVPSIDLGTWRGGRKDPPAFGSDISVIEKPKDTRLMPEDLKDIEAGLRKKNRNNGRTRNSTSNRHLPRKSRVNLDARHSQSRFSNRSETYFYNERRASSNDNNYNDGALDMTNDVIGDLNNLSMQIQRGRTGRR